MATMTAKTDGPGIFAHMVSLLMPFTMVVLAPWWILSGGEVRRFFWCQLFGGVLFCAGLTLFLATEKLFVVRGKGTLAPWDATRHLIVVGPYRYCRNPMISGVLGMILGEALFFGSVPILVWAFGFFVINTVYFVLAEEPTLQKKFGKEYAAYRLQVPRWLPRIRPYRK